jgi:hypothetical protein
MSELTDLYSKNFSLRKKSEFERSVRDVSVDMSELSAIQLCFSRNEQKKVMKDGGIMSLESFAYGGLAKMLGE